MSQENVEVTRRAFQAFNDRDLDALLAVLDTDVVAFPILAAMEGAIRAMMGSDAGGPLCSAPFPTSARSLSRSATSEA